MMKSMLRVMCLSLLIAGGFVTKEASAATDESVQTIESIRMNMSAEDFQSLDTQYTEDEIISIIEDEIESTLGALSEEITIDLNNRGRSLPQVNVFDLKTESGYEFQVYSEIKPEVTPRAPENITGNYDSSFDHTVKVKALSGTAGESLLITKVQVSKGSIAGSSTTPKCSGVGVVYCDQSQKDSWVESYSMPGTYSSFKSRGVYVYKGDVSVLGGVSYTHNLHVKYGCTGYNGTTKKVTIKVEY